jgi:hypothetical protein
LPWREEFPRESLAAAERDSAAAGLLRYVALHDAVIAGGAGLAMFNGVAQMAGAATAPAHRRREQRLAAGQNRPARARADRRRAADPAGGAG